MGGFKEVVGLLWGVSTFFSFRFCLGWTMEPEVV